MRRIFRWLMSLGFVLLIISIPMGGQSSGHGQLRLQVIAPSGRSVGAGAQVRMQTAGGSQQVRLTDQSGEVVFTLTTSGTYRAWVVADGYQETDTGNIQVDGTIRGQNWRVHMRPRPPEDLVITNVKDATVDVSVLKIRREALHEVAKGTEYVKKREWAKAAKHLEKALAIEPNFSVALNNLAVAYGFLGDHERERETLDRSLALNGHNVAALTNRSYVALREHDLEGAEAFLKRAVAADPRNVQTLSVLAKVQLAAGHYNAVVLSAGQAHGFPHEQYVIVHYLAARALEKQNEAALAAAELRLFLQEEPEGQWSTGARRELELLEAGIIPEDVASPQPEAARVR